MRFTSTLKGQNVINNKDSASGCLRWAMCVCASADPRLVFRLVRRSNTPAARSAKRKRNLEGGGKYVV